MDGTKEQMRQRLTALHEELNEARALELKLRRREDMAVQAFTAIIGQSVEASRKVRLLEDQYRSLAKKRTDIW